MVFSFNLHIVSSTGLNVSLTDTVFGKELESLVGIGDLLVTKSGDCANFAMQVQFMSLPGDLPEMMVRFSFNSFLTSGIVHPYRFGESMCSFRGF